jgi:hypothetical protein
MRVFVTGPSPLLLLGQGRISSYIWNYAKETYSDCTGCFFGLPADQVQGRMLPLARGASAAVNFGVLCETGKPDLVVSIGSDSDASHVAATLAVGMADFRWVHILIDEPRWKRRPYESIIDADLVVAVGDNAAAQADDSGCRNLIQVKPISPVSAFEPVLESAREKYFICTQRNFETSNLEYLKIEWEKSGLARDGWEMVLATNGADPGEYDMSLHRLPLGFRLQYHASSLSYGIADSEWMRLISKSWGLVDVGLCSACGVSEYEATSVNVGSIVSAVTPGETHSHLLKSTQFFSSSGQILHIPVGGDLSRILNNSISNPLLPSNRKASKNICEIMPNIFENAGRKLEFTYVKSD